MSGNKWWSTKVGAKLLSDLVISLIFSSDISLDFHELIRVVPLKYLMYFLTGIKLNNFEIFLKKKWILNLWILNLFIKSFAKPFLDIALTFLW